MTKNFLSRRRVLTGPIAAVCVGVLLAGCTTTDEAVPEDPVDSKEGLNIGVSLSSPGLIAGSDPTEVSGAEVEIARAVAAQLDPESAEMEIQWVPTEPDDAADALASGDLTLLIGQFSGAQLTEDIAWVGPYGTVDAGLLVRQKPTADDASPTSVLAFDTVRSADDVADAAVCVVADSMADGPKLPVGSVTVQHTATECEIGLRSGRYDAIAGDTLQLAGVQADQNITANYELLLWSELETDEDVELPKELLASEQYWIGVGAQDCAAAASALATVVDDGLLADAFASWEDATDAPLQLADATELTTQYCK